MKILSRFTICAISFCGFLLAAGGHSDSAHEDGWMEKWLSFDPGLFMWTIVTFLIVLAILKWNISPLYLSNANIFYLIFSIILLSICGQVGDLFFSRIKRIKKIKDFGNIFPGHGGVLDRIDSSLFIFILGYFVLLKWVNL